MYLPLLIAGVEKIIKNKKIGTLAVVVAFAFASIVWKATCAALFPSFTFG